MDGNTSYSTEGLKDPSHFALQSLPEVERDGFGYDGVPAFLVDAYSLLESWEEVVPLVEVPGWERDYL